MNIYLNDNWSFTEQYSKPFVEGEDIADTCMVRIPHSVVTTPFNYFDEQLYQKEAAYRKWIDVPKEWSGKSIEVVFEGVAHESELFVNGESIMTHSCGYTAFRADISQYLKYGEKNLLAVRVDSRENLNVPPFGYVIDYMTYGGIYRDVYLDVRERSHIEDVFVTCNINDSDIVNVDTASKISVLARISIKRHNGDNSKIKLLIDDEVAAVKRTSENKTEILAELTNVNLWNTKHPNLHKVTVELLSEDEVIDTQTVVTGFRKAVFKKEGFYLNGEKFKIRGLNRHQSFPYVGYAMPESIQREDARILKEELAVNAVRTSHYPQSHYFLSECDRIGLLVFTEIPGWQHIGDEAWKEQAIINTEDMILQYRNHPSIIMWGVRINESIDDDPFYEKTNAVARLLDPSRPTGGVRAHKNSSFLEDVYTYNDFVHDGKTKGCEQKKDVTPDTDRPYLVSEYNGHMFPTKSYDAEEHLREHAIRHANVLNAIYGEEDIAGSFGWCMADYNTHKDFGSGDRICYHGVLDMYRNPKQAAAIYSAFDEDKVNLSISSSMDIGEHPGCNRGQTYIYSNADSVKMYKNEKFLKEYYPNDSEYKNLPNGPILINDFVGNAILEQENFSSAQADAVKKLLNAYTLYGMGMPKSYYPLILKVLTVYHMKFGDAVSLFNKYIGDWGGKGATYRFEACKGGKVVKTLIKEAVKETNLDCQVSSSELEENTSFDVAAIRIRAVDQNGNILPFFNEPITLKAEGDIEIIGPEIISLKGGMCGTYVKSLGRKGTGVLTVANSQLGEKKIEFSIDTGNRKEQM